jgi:translocation and assembly module TamB
LNRTKGALLSLFLLLGLLLGLLIVVPLTPAGTRLLVASLDKMTPLDVSYLEGSLAGRLKLAQLGLTLETVDIQLRGIEIELNSGCLLSSRICFETLILDSLKIDVLAGKPESDREEPVQIDSELYEFPVTIEADDFVIRQAEIQWLDGGWSNGEIKGDVSISVSKIIVTDVHSEQSFLQLNSPTDDNKDPDAIVELPRLNLPLELVVEGLTLDRPSWSFNELGHQHESIKLSGRWRNTDLLLASVAVSSEDWGRISLAGSVDMQGDWPINIEGDTFIDRPPLWPGLHQRSGNLAVGGTLAEMQVNAETPGEKNFKLSGLLNSLAQDIPFEMKLSASWSGPLPLADVPGLESEMPEVQLVSPWVLRAQGSLVQQRFSIEGGASTAQYADLTLAMKARLLETELAIDSVHIQDSNTDSALTVEGVVSFEDSLLWDLTIHSSGVDIPRYDDVLAGRLAGSLETRGRFEQAHWQVAVDSVALEGNINNMPSQISGGFSLDNQWQFGDSDMRINTSGAKLSVVSSENSPPQIDLEIDDLGAWLPDSRGALSFTSELTSAQQRIEFRAEARDLSWQGLLIPLGAVHGYYTIPGGSHDDSEFEVSFRLDELVFNDQKLTDIEGVAAGNREAHSLTLSSRGEFETVLLVKGGFVEEQWSGLLQPTAIAVATGHWKLDRPVALSWRGSSTGLEVAAHCWGQGAARICPAELILAEQGTAGIDLDLGLELLDDFIPDELSLSGDLKASLSFTWTPEKGLLGGGSANISSGSFIRSVSGEEVVISWDQVQVETGFSDRAITVESSVWRNEMKQLQLKLALPNEENAIINGTLMLDSFGLVGVLKPFFPIFSDHTGQLDGEIHLSGTKGNPSLHGDLALSGGQLSLIGNSTTFEQIEVALTASGKQVDVAGSALIGGGETQLSGRLFLDPEPTLELSVSGIEQAVLLPPGLTALVSEDLHVAAVRGHVELNGEIIVHEGMLEHEQLPAGSIDVSPDVVEVDYGGEIIGEAGAFDLAANVRLKILDEFRVEGTGLTTRVGGELDLKKEVSEPLQLYGQLNILDGEINAFGQQLTIQRGDISFVGDSDNPDLNIRAERNIKNESIKVGVEVLGNLEAFTFNVYSTPELPESEAMSYLLRGRGLDQGAEADGAAMALSLGLGAVNQTGVVEGINKIPGLSDVSFNTDGDADNTTATVSGYVGQRIYLAYGVGVYEPINVLTTRFYLQAQLWLEIVSSLESSVDLYYSFDIE